MKMPPARATNALVVVTSLAWVVVALAGWSVAASTAGGFVPARIGSAAWPAGSVPVWATPITATLLHGSIMHLLFNVTVLGFCGRSVEPSIGTSRFLLLYVAGAYAAALGQWLAGPASLVPMIGASGATSAVLAAQALLFGNRRIAPGGRVSAHMLQILWLAAAWIGLQILTGLAMRGTVAIAAHIGGFIAGLLLARPLLRSRYRRQR